MKSKQSYVIGIDIGGTHVDIVAVDSEERIIAFHKEMVSVSLAAPIIQAIRSLLRFDLDIKSCTSIHLGTTIGINSLLELKSLYRVGVLRIAGHVPDLPPAFSWPLEKKRAIVAGFASINGGYEYDKKRISTLNSVEVHAAIQQLINQGAESIAIVGVFSPLYHEDETEVAHLIEPYKIPFTLSHEVGGLGFIERENNSIINATLKKVVRAQFHYLEAELAQLGFECEVSITQNNGTLLSLEEALRFPIKTISSGPTNSLNGACKLANLEDAIVIDIGGTSTEIGRVENGFPCYSSMGATIAGIPTNFMLPNLDILALGGGSIIRYHDKTPVIGPDSLGARVFSESQSFQGDHLTLFDVGNVLQQQCPLHGVIPSLSREEASHIMQQVVAQLEDGIETMGMDQEQPVLLVGGGAKNIPAHFLKENRLRPNHYQVANAYGAALAEICGTVDAIHQLAENRQGIIEMLEKEAIQKALENGAQKDSIRIIEKRLLPFYYMDNQLTRIIISAAGKKQKF